MGFNAIACLCVYFIKICVYVFSGVDFYVFMCLCVYVAVFLMCLCVYVDYEMHPLYVNIKFNKCITNSMY
jgi:hypothetical protein